VSVGCFELGEALGLALASVEAQTFCDLEIAVVDDRPGQGGDARGTGAPRSGACAGAAHREARAPGRAQPSCAPVIWQNVSVAAIVRSRVIKFMGFRGSSGAAFISNARSNRNRKKRRAF
jgi:hypothetical protein